MVRLPEHKTSNGKQTFTLMLVVTENFWLITAWHFAWCRVKQKKRDRDMEGGTDVKPKPQNFN